MFQFFIVLHYILTVEMCLMWNNFFYENIESCSNLRCGSVLFDITNWYSFDNRTAGASSVLRLQKHFFCYCFRILFEIMSFSVFSEWALSCTFIVASMKNYFWIFDFNDRLGLVLQTLKLVQNMIYLMVFAKYYWVLMSSPKKIDWNRITHLPKFHDSCSGMTIASRGALLQLYIQFSHITIFKFVKRSYFLY